MKENSKKKWMRQEITLFVEFESEANFFEKLKEQTGKYTKKFDKLTTSYFADDIFELDAESEMLLDKKFVNVENEDNINTFDVYDTNKNEHYILPLSNIEFRLYKLLEMKEGWKYIAAIVIRTEIDFHKYYGCDPLTETLKSDIYKINQFSSKFYKSGDYPDDRDIKINFDNKALNLFANDQKSVIKNLKQLAIDAFEMNPIKLPAVTSEKMINENSALYSAIIFNGGFRSSEINYLDLEESLKKPYYNEAGEKIDNPIDEFLALQNIDTATNESLCIQNDKMKIDEFVKGSYWRWTNSGSMFVYNPNVYINTVDNSLEYLIGNHVHIYFELFYIVQLQKAILNIYHDTVMKKGESAKRDLKFCKAYFECVNTYLYRRVTCEIQGIDLYEELININQIPKFEQEVSADVAIIQDQLSVDSTDEVNTTVDKLTKEANLIAYVSLALATIALLAALPSGYTTAIADTSFNQIVPNIRADLVLWTIFVTILGVACYGILVLIVKKSLGKEE